MLTEENPGISILRWKCLGFLIVWRTPSDILYYNEKGKAGRLSPHTGREAARQAEPAYRSRGSAEKSFRFALHSSRVR